MLSHPTMAGITYQLFNLKQLASVSRINRKNVPESLDELILNGVDEILLQSDPERLSCSIFTFHLNIPCFKSHNTHLNQLLKCIFF